MAIKILNERLTYFEQEKRIELEINKKVIVAFKYEKQDPAFSDYEVEVKIENEDLLTEEEYEEINEYIKNDL